MDFYKGTIPIIDDYVEDHELFGLTGEQEGPPTYGAVPRDWSVQPEGDIPTFGHDPQATIPIIPRSEWDARYDEQEAAQSSLEHLYLKADGTPRFVNLDQNGDGYCWIYSTTQALMIARLFQNQPLVRLNPHCGGAIIKNGRNEGGWCGLSAKFIIENGCAEEGTGPDQWPLHSRQVSRVTPALREAMKKYRITEGWIDLTRQAYDQDVTDAAYASLLLSNCPTASDFNWWAHSVCAIRWVRIEAGSWGPLILNSWKGWGRHGLAVLRGSKGSPTGGAVGVRAARAA